MSRIWIQHPLAVLADSDASAGLVIEGNRIAEVLPAGAQPASPCDTVFLGTLAVGMQADLAMFKLDELRFFGSHEPLTALLLCGAQKADRVMVTGKWTVEDGVIPGLDLTALMHEHWQTARTLASRAR